MTLYNMLFNTEPTAGIALKMLGISHGDVPRFRDAYFTWADEEMTDPVIVIHTRTGGGNRAFYESAQRCREEYPECFGAEEPHPVGPWNEDLVALRGYRRDQDCEHDSTYADFYFSVPDAEKEGVIAFLKAHGKPATAAEKFAAALAAIRRAP